MFWIQGKPGSGKSTLMSYIEKASRSWQIDSASDSQWSAIRFFFDFRAQSGLANSLEGFLRSLLFQILKQNRSSMDELHRLEEKFGNYKPGAWASSALKEAFVNALHQISVNICVLVDGLDEFSGDMHDLLTFFYKIPSATNTGHLVKICLASRPHPVIALALGDWPGLQMEAHNTNAIEQYANTAMENLGVAADDRLQLSTGIAEKAEGVFLWARFAVKEIINGYSEGEDIGELNQRLEALPSDMEELYAHILRRLKSRDREEAQLMFQLVCFAQGNFQLNHIVNFINLRQLKEAAAVLPNDLADHAHFDSVGGLEKFRRRFKAKTGGLLEEVFDKSFGIASDRDPDSDQELYKRNGGTIKLVHRTAESYLDREGWFSELKFLQIMSPQALWLHVCCKSIEGRLGPQELQLRHAEPTELEIDESTKASLFEYASRNLFVHARLLEAQYQKSALPFLETVSPVIWQYLRKLHRRQVYYSYYEVDWDAVDEWSDRQPWQIIVEQGLPISLRDAALKSYYTSPSDGMDISFALTHVPNFYEMFQPGYEGCRVLAQQLLSILIEFGAVVREGHIFECLYFGRADLLGTLLASWSEEKIRLKRRRVWVVYREVKSSLDPKDDDYNGDSVGVLWELVRGSDLRKVNLKAMLVLLLERGESLNEISGPGGTALHGSIIRAYHERYHKPFVGRAIRLILNHGADPNFSGPRGTPLQLAWRMFRSITIINDRVSFQKSKHLHLQQAMELLLDAGANPSWVEPNGISIDRRTIQIWCAMSYKELKARWYDHDYPYCVSNWYTYEFPLYHSSRKSSETPSFRRTVLESPEPA